MMYETIQNPEKFDFILVGGGLQSGLIALALAHEQPDKKCLIVGREPQLGGNHVGSKEEKGRLN